MSTTESQPGEQLDALCDVLRALASGAAGDRRADRTVIAGPRLDDRSRAVAGLGALFATGGSSSAYERLVANALDAGISAEEIVDVLFEVAQTVGLARLVPAAIELGYALGYDIDRALEGAPSTVATQTKICRLQSRVDTESLHTVWVMTSHVDDGRNALRRHALGPRGVWVHGWRDLTEGGRE